MDEAVSFGQILRKYRRARDLTQEELARRIACALATVKKIEADERRPSRELAERLAQVLEVSPTDQPIFLRLARGLSDVALSLPVLAPVLTAQEIGADDLSGREIRGYSLRERLGIGGFGAVYRAVQSSVQREVAVKIILPRVANHPDFIRRFIAEAQFVARLEHPHIVPLYDFWREPDSAYLVMRYLRGGSLAAALWKGPLPPLDVLRVLQQIGAALTVAHRSNVVHRDLKPANVLRDSEGNAYLADFGIAKNLSNSNSADITQAGVIIGSPDYLSPEQIIADPVTARTDIYSLGVMLYELLTASKPFTFQTPAELLRLHLTEPLPSLRIRRPELPEALDTIIWRATAKHPAQRYEDVGTLVAAFETALVGSGNAQVEHRVVPTTALLNVPDIENPYKGLRAFDQADAADFFGRSMLIGRLLERLAEEHASARFLAVVGPSGSGKSSVVRAGLLPALRQGGLPGSEHWFITEMLPGTHPLEELELSLLKVAVRQPPGLAEQLQRNSRGLLRAARLVLPGDDSELVLVIDQFEELFTLVTDRAARAHILDSLVAAVTDIRSHVRVIVTLRADFYDRPLDHAGLGELMRERTEVVLPLSADELAEAIVAPAKRVGAIVEPELVAEIVRDVANQPGPLPLLQYALTELFDQREGRVLTRAAYRASGGVHGALSRRAESIFLGLSPAAQDAARQAFLRLVTLGEGSEDTRRRTLISELTSPLPANLGVEAAAASYDEWPRMQQVIDVFGNARLLTFDRDPITRGPTVEVAHEALIRGWTRLQAWLSESRSSVRVQRQLAGAAAEWIQHHHDTDFLALGTRLAQFAALAESSDIALNAAERAYLDASLTEADRRDQAERNRQTRELAQVRVLAEEQRERADAAQRAAQAQRNASNRLRYLVGALVVFLIVAAGLSAFAFQQRSEAQANFTRSEAQRLATEANTLIAEHGNIDIATLLAIRSIRTQYTPQGDKALASVLQVRHPQYRVPGNILGIRRFDISKDSQRAATINADGTVQVWNLTDGAVTHMFQAHTDMGTDLRFLPESNRLVTGGHDGRLVIWNLTTMQPIHEFRHGSYIRAVEMTPDGRLLFSGGEQDPRVHVWDVATGKEIRTVVADETAILSMDVSPDGRLLLVGGFDSVGKLIDIQTGTVLRRLEGHTDWLYDVNFAPDGATAMTVSPDSTIRIWHVGSGQELRQFSGHTQEIWDAQFSADGRLAITGSWDGTARVWEYGTGKELYRLNAHTTRVSAVAISPDGHYALTNGVDNWETALVWDLQQRPSPLPLRGHTNIVWSMATAQQSMYAVSGSFDTTVRFWDIGQGQLLQTFEASGLTTSAVAISSDGRYLLSGSFDRKTRLWDTTTGAMHVIAEHPKAEGIIGVNFSPDGRYALSVGLYDQTAYLIDVKTGAQVWEIHGPSVGVAAFSPDGEQLVMLATPSCCDTSIKGGIAIHDARTGQKLQDYPRPDLYALGKVAFSPDGTYFAVSGPRDIYVWRVGDPASRRDFTGHTDSVEGIAFSYDGRQLLSGSWDGTARLWDVATGRELRRLTVAGGGGVHAVAFAADQRHFLTAHDDHLVRVWHVEINESVTALCTRLLRDFTPEERAQYDIAQDGPTCPTP